MRLTRLIAHYDDGSNRVLYEEATPAPVPQLPPLTNQSRVGVNLELPNSGSGPVYIDAIKQARPIGVDTEGDPLAQIIFVEQKDARGTYTLYTENNVGVTLFDSGASRVVGPPMAVADVWESLIEVPKDTPQLKIRYSAAPGKVVLLRSGYTPDQAKTQIVTNEYLDGLAPFGRIRFMDFTGTNASPQVEWSDRPTLDSPTWDRVRLGAPWEVVFSLLRQTRKDGWCCLPHACSDDYALKLNALAEEIVPDDQQIIGELGNESVWNTDHPWRVGWLHAKSIVAPFEHQPGSIYHEADGKWNLYNAIHYWWAHRTYQIAQLMPRFKFILSNQNGYGKDPVNKPHELGWWHKKQLGWLRRQGIEPSSFLYAIASAPYGSPNNTDPKPEHRKAIKAIADQYGLKYVAYECGFHDENGGQEMIDLHRSEQIAPAVESILNNYFGSGLDEVLWYQYSTRFTGEKCWGLLDQLRRTPKYDAAAKVAQERLR